MKQLMLSLFTLAILCWTCQQEQIQPLSLQINPAVDKKKPGPPPCAPSTFCVNVSNHITGCQSVTNCTGDTKNRIIVSESSGPNANMDLTFHFAMTNNCEFDGQFTGPLVINSDGSIEYYFKDLFPNHKNKYVLLASATSMTGTWEEGNINATFTYLEGEIKKDGKHDSDCLGPVSFDPNTTITISTVTSAGDCDSGYGYCP